MVNHASIADEGAQSWTVAEESRDVSTAARGETGYGFGSERDVEGGSAIRHVEAVALVDLDPGQGLAPVGEFVALAGWGLFCVEQFQACRQPLFSGGERGLSHVEFPVEFGVRQANRSWRLSRSVDKAPCREEQRYSLQRRSRVCDAANDGLPYQRGPLA